MYGQLINLLDKEILRFSRKYHGKRYAKHFDAYQHLTVMLLSHGIHMSVDKVLKIAKTVPTLYEKLAQW
jgi:hypothetical protein